MSKKKQLFRGPKVTTNHQTVIDGAVPVLQAIKNLDSVNKVVIGPIEPNRSASPRLKLRPIPAGLFLKVQSRESLQQFYIYTSDPETVKSFLNSFPLA